MSEDLAERISLRRYLLGEISDEAELRRIEERLLVDDDFQEELAMEEEELIDRYIFDELSAGESARFREHFLCHPEREARLELAQRLKVYATEQRRSEPARPRTEITSSPRIAPWFRTIPLSLKIAASILLAIGLGLFIWKVAFRQSDVDRSLVALNAAYRDQRPVEARISNFNYAPYLTTRGAGSEKVDQNELRRAELTLLDARSPTPRVYHALGKVYLAQRDFDKAIEQFDEALKGDSKNAQIYSDLGAAYLEKGKIDLEKGKTEPASSEAGKGMEELGRSLENLKRAIELNANLLEALFNRALCRQYLMLPQQAEEDWHEYLKRDSTSAWAEEARRNLQRLEERKKQ
jgi:tetratricopeptide (TPR) repeat protein